MEFRDMFGLFRKRAWIIAMIMLISCMTTGFFTYYVIQPVYEASAKLIVNKASSEEGFPQLTWSDVNLNVQLIATYKELILTAAIMEEVLKQYPQITYSAEQLTGMINVSSVNNTQVMTVTAESESYETAVLIVNAVSRVFQQKVIEIMNVDNVTILDEASANIDAYPVWPNPVANMAVSFILSMILGVVLILLIEHLDDTIKNEEDVHKYLGFPVLAVIHRMERKDFPRQRSSKSVKKAGENVYAAANR